MEFHVEPAGVAHGFSLRIAPPQGGGSGVTVGAWESLSPRCRLTEKRRCYCPPCNKSQLPRWRWLFIIKLHIRYLEFTITQDFLGIEETHLPMAPWFPITFSTTDCLSSRIILIVSNLLTEQWQVGPLVSSVNHLAYLTVKTTYFNIDCCLISKGY